MKAPARLGLLIVFCAAACARPGSVPRGGLAAGDGVWFEDGIGTSAGPNLEESLAHAGLSTVYLPALRLSGEGGRWQTRELPAPAQPLLKSTVFLVVDGGKGVDEALATNLSAAAIEDAVWVGLRAVLKNTSRFGPVGGVHLDLPFNGASAANYGAAVAALHKRLPRGMLLTVSLRFAPSEKERESFKALSAGCDGYVAFLFGEGPVAEPASVDALEKHWRAAYAPSSRGTWQDASGQARGTLPEWILSRLLDEPRAEFLPNVSLKDEADQSFLLRLRSPVDLGGGYAFGAGDRLLFRQPIAADLIYHVGADPAGRRFARGRVLALPGRDDSERIFTLAAIDEVLLGKPAQPGLRVTVQAERGAIAVSAENESPHASAVSRSTNWVEVEVPGAGIRDVQLGGFDRFEVYGSDRMPVTMGLATFVRFFEFLIDAHEKIAPARILFRGPAPRDCCRTRFHLLGASGQETLSPDGAPTPARTP